MCRPCCPFYCIVIVSLVPENFLNCPTNVLPPHLTQMSLSFRLDLFCPCYGTIKVWNAWKRDAFKNFFPSPTLLNFVARRINYTWTRNQEKSCKTRKLHKLSNRIQTFSRITFKNFIVKLTLDGLKVKICKCNPPYCKYAVYECHFCTLILYTAQ